MKKDRKSCELKLLERFGEFLVNKGIVEENAVLDALNFQRKEGIPVGKIALKEKMLTWKQIYQVLNAQFDTTKRFGEVAIELGFLVEEEVNRLLEIQKKLRLPLGKILVKLEKIDDETLDRELTNYYNYLENYKGSK